MKRFLISYGTRPEWIKIRPLVKKMQQEKIAHEVVFIEQQKDIASGEFTKKIKLPANEINRLDAIVTACLNDDWIFQNIDFVIVQGDTTSALGIALAAFHRQIPVIHLEAGLRTYSKNPYPEEGNRRMIDAISEIHLCPTNNNKKNIKDENTFAYAVRTGNTGLDNLKGLKCTSYSNIVLCTMHRRENHRDMDQWFIAINECAKKLPELQFILPLHPNPNVQKHKHLLTHVQVKDPIASISFCVKSPVRTRWVGPHSGWLSWVSTLRFL